MMNDYNLGYNAYIAGVSMDNQRSLDWQRGWLAAEADNTTHILDTIYIEGYRAFYAGIEFSFLMPPHWRHGWNAAFGDAMREHSKRVSLN